MIRSVDRVARPLAGISLTASKGIFGRFGRFWNSTLGSYRLFLTNRESVVWLQTTSDGWVAISPDRADEFVVRLRTRIQAAPSAWYVSCAALRPGARRHRDRRPARIGAAAGQRRLRRAS